MLSNLTTIVLVTASALALLSMIQLFLAVRNDRAATAAGPIEELAVYEARLQQKEALLADIEGELEQRRKALADIAGVQAEVDALIRQREALLTEWATLAEKKEEVLAVRSEMEAAQIERQSLEAELVEKREEYLSVKERLEKAEQLVHQISIFEAQKAELEKIVDDLSDQVRRLEDAEKRVADLTKRALDLEANLARKEGALSACEDDLEDVLERLKAERASAAESSAKLSQVQAEKAAEDQALARVKSEIADAEERLNALRSASGACETEIKNLQQKLEDRQTLLAEITSDINTQKSLKDDLDDELTTLRFELGAAETSLEERTSKLQSLSDRWVQMEAKLATLQHSIEQSEGALTGSVSPSIDPLKELKEHPPVIVQLENLDAPGQISEAEAIHNVEKRLQAFGLTYHPRVIRAFHTAMKVNESTQMAVLAGISGTGKSQLPRQYASAMGIGFLQVPVQPRWDSPQDLMGFYNYIEGKFRPTDMARALWAMDGHNNKDAIQDRMMMVLLDEMNLARVEYYFSDFLSRLESRPGRDHTDDKGLRKDAEIELEIPKLATPPRIFPGYNLLFAGTMNEDESTQSLSDKVVDRANILRFAAPKKIQSSANLGQAPDVRALSQTKWQSWGKPVSLVANDATMSKSLSQMVEVMRDFKRPFGHRLGRAIMDYVANYPETDGLDRIRAALADQVEMRLLPKLRGVEIDDMEHVFGNLKAFVENELGDATLAEAIMASMEAAEGTGQFVWSGVTR